MSYCYTAGTYNRYPSLYGSQYVQSFSSSANFDQGEISIQDFRPSPSDFFNWDDLLLPPSAGSVAQASATLPIQTNTLSSVPLLPHSYLDIGPNHSRALSVAAPVPVAHAALTKAALRTMMSLDDKGNIYRISLEKKLNWHERYLQDKVNGTPNNNFAGGSEPLKIPDARTRVDFDNNGLRVNGGAEMNCSALVDSGSRKQTTAGRSKLVIRPISPSTLIALTEPCLMAWCTPFDDSLAEPGSSAYLTQSSEYNNYVDKNNTAVYNVWGY